MDNKNGFTARPGGITHVSASENKKRQEMKKNKSKTAPPDDELGKGKDAGKGGKG